MIVSVARMANNKAENFMKFQFWIDGHDFKKMGFGEILMIFD
jgi:hypothetical protein